MLNSFIEGLKRKLFLMMLAFPFLLAAIWIVPDFLNMSVQDIDQFVREVEEHPKGRLNPIPEYGSKPSLLEAENLFEEMREDGVEQSN